jgi:hypothetical protein
MNKKPFSHTPKQKLDKRYKRKPKGVTLEHIQKHHKNQKQQKK